MVSELNKLGELVELDSLPAWIREQIETRKEEILRKLQTDGFFVFTGPDGEQVTIKQKARAATAI
jgi:hypothetical protein